MIFKLHNYTAQRCFIYLYSIQLQFGGACSSVADSIVAADPCKHWASDVVCSRFISAYLVSQKRSELSSKYEDDTIGKRILLPKTALRWIEMDRVG